MKRFMPVPRDPEDVAPGRSSLDMFIVEHLHTAVSRFPDEFRGALPAIMSDSDLDEDARW
jgi:hypothetical protein